MILSVLLGWMWGGSDALSFLSPSFVLVLMPLFPWVGILPATLVRVLVP